MAKSIPALITPSVLKWARELDSITVEEAATHLKVSIEKNRVVGKWRCTAFIKSSKETCQVL